MILLSFKGINVKKQNLTLDFIKTELLKKCACIVLIDSSKLKEALNFDKDISDNFLLDETNLQSPACCLFGNRFKEENKSEDYCGHFIVVIGYDNQKNIIYFR